MRVYARGQEIEVPTDSQGNAEIAQVRRVANIPDDRMLIQQKPNGENAILPRRGLVNISQLDRFMDAPRAVRGQL